MKLDRRNITKSGDIYITNEGKYWYFCGNCEEYFEHVESYEFHYLDIHFELDKYTETSSNTQTDQEITQKNDVNESKLKSEECQALSEPLIELDNKNEDFIELQELDIKSSIGDSDMEENLTWNAYTNESSSNENDLKRTENCLESHAQSLINQKVKIEITDSNMDEIDYEKKYIDFIKCNFCDKHFTNLLTLKLHENNSHISRRCNLCKVEFKQKKLLAAHLKEKHVKILTSSPDETLESSDEKTITCEICQRYFNDEMKLFSHIVRHNQPGVCPICKDKTDSLKFHIKNSHPNYNKFQCKICKKLFKTSQALLNHSYTHEKSNKTVDCKVCGQTFKSFRLLDIHLISVHTNENKKKILKKYKYRFPCTFKDCKKVYPGKNELNRHMLSHTGIRPFMCTKCPATFTSSQNLKLHFIYKHVDLYNFPCTYENCNKKFKTNDTLKRHIKYLHIRDFNHKCNYCDKSFRTSSNLDRHTQSWHTDRNLWKHQCHICDKKFVASSTLKEHIVIHFDEKPFICEICSSSFSLLKRLKDHQKIHADKKQHKCTVCGMEFAQYPGLFSHMKRTHRK